MHLKGEGVDRCSCTAREWLEKAAAQGISVAQRFLDKYLVNSNFVFNQVIVSLHHTA